MDDTKKKLRQLNKLAWEKEKGGMYVLYSRDGILLYDQRHPRTWTATSRRTQHSSRNVRLPWVQT